MFTILLIDSYPMALEGLKYFLRSEFKEVSVVAFGDASTSIEKSKRCRPDLILIANNAPEFGDSLEAAEVCKAAFRLVPTIIYDHSVHVDRVLSYLKLGVTGYILKENPVTEIITCIEKVLSGKFYLTSAVMEVLINNTMTKMSDLKIKKQRGLSPRESEIASYLSNGNGTKWISNRLNIRPSTVSTIKKNIFLKMKVGNVIQLQEMMKSEL